MPTKSNISDGEKSATFCLKYVGMNGPTAMSTSYHTIYSDTATHHTYLIPVLMSILIRHHTEIMVQHTVYTQQATSMFLKVGDTSHWRELERIRGVVVAQVILGGLD